MNPYLVLSAVVSFAAGGVVAGGVMQMTLRTDVTCTVAQADPPRLPSTLFQTQPIPHNYKSW